MRKSRGRRRVLFALNAVHEAYFGQLARMVGVSHQRLRGLLQGHMPYYSPDLSLDGQGLAEIVDGPKGRLVRITARGRRKARSEAKRYARGERL